MGRDGGVIDIDKASGIARLFSRSRDCDAMGPRTKEIVHCETLPGIDFIDSRTQGFLAFFTGGRVETCSEVREQIDTKSVEWREESTSSLMLDIYKCFSFLNTNLESVLPPMLKAGELITALQVHSIPN